ncbi:MAG: hypothetical protein ACRERD_27790 [Candidatus Binatia bacterium]
MDSTSKYTTKSLYNDFIGRAVAEALARPIIKRGDDGCKMVILDFGEIRSPGKVAS